MKNLRMAEELIKVAESLVFADSDYIYDPEHKKHPSGGYHKTEKGWSKSEENKQENSSLKVKTTLDPKSPKGKYYLRHLQTLAVLKEEGKFQGKKHQMALNPNTSQNTLDKLSNDSSFVIRNFVSKNPNTHSKTLDKLSNAKEGEIRASVAKHPNSSIETLKKLSKDKEDYVAELAKNNIAQRA